MASKKPKHFFVEWLRCHKKPQEALQSVKQQYLQGQILSSEGAGANPQLLGSLNPVTQNEENQLAQQQRPRSENKNPSVAKDHFQNMRFTSVSSSYSQSPMLALDTTHSIFQTAESFVQHMQLEVREVLQSMTVTQGKTSNLQTLQGNAAKSPVHSSSNKEVFFAPQRTFSNNQSSNASVRLSFLNFQDHSAQNVGDNFFKGSFELVGLRQPVSEESSLVARKALNPLVANAAQSFLQKNSIQTASQAMNAGLFHSLDSTTEGSHLVSWAKQLGVSPQVLHSLLPALLHFQELGLSSKSFLQGLMLFYGIFTGASQNSVSNLTWVLLKGMMILETQTQLNQVHSPLLDELGALLSTSRRRLRRRTKKRTSGLDKVARKDSCLADMDAQETAQDDEALIDLWPKKESNNPSMSFFYM